MESQNSITLSKKDERRLDDLFTQFSKSEPNALRFHEFLMFCIDRTIVSSRVSFSVLYDLFLDCIDEEETASNKEKSLTKSQFNFLLVQLSRILFPGDKSKSNLERLINEVLLIEKTVATKDGIESQRVPVFDETTRKLLTEGSINVLCQYEDELKSCFITYLSENYENNEIILSWKEIALQKRKISTHGFIKFLKEGQVIPLKITYENVEDVMVKMVPPVSVKENDFYHRKRIIQICEKDLEGIDQHYEGDPGLHFHEFQLSLCRIAYEERRNKTEEKFDINDILKYFFENILGIRKNNQIETQPFPNINKKLYGKLRQYYQELKEADEKYQKKEQNNQDDEQMKDPMQMLAELQNQQIFEADPVYFDINDIKNILNKDLPPIPQKPVVTPENPPPYKMADKKNQVKVLIGDQPPEEKDKDKANKATAKAAKKPQQLKKGEKPPRAIIFEGFPPPDPKMNYDHLEKQHNELTYGQKNLSEVNRGTMSEIDVLPLLLQEILYPPQTPSDVRYLIESAINSYNDQNYILALKHFEEAKQKWTKSDEMDMTDQIQLFFEYSKASIYQSAGRDDYALYYYMQCKVISDKLPYTNPDRAMSYSGLGYVLFSMEEYQMSLRAFLKCREIREKLYGSEHVDTGCTFNNLGCCMYMLERNQEALGYFTLANSIFDCELGAFHNRTLVSAQNIKKTERGYFQNDPDFATLWETYEEDAFKKKKGAAKKKKK